MLTLVASQDGAQLRGRWFRLHYSQSFAGQPVRPLVRFIRETGREEHILSAPALGRSSWTWRAPRDLERLEVLVAEGAADAIRIDMIKPMTRSRLLLGILSRRPRSILPFFLHESERSRNVSTHEAFDLAAPEAFDRSLRERRRPLEPTGFDAQVIAEAASGPRLGFVVTIEAADELDPLHRTLAAFAGQHDRGFRLLVQAPPDLVAAIDRQGLGAALEIVTSFPSEPVADYVARLLPGDEPMAEAVLCLRAFLARHPALDILYCDSAERNADGRLMAQLKPDWSPTFQAHRDYAGRPCLVRTPHAEGLRAPFVPADPSPAGQGRARAGRRTGVGIPHSPHNPTPVGLRRLTLPLGERIEGCVAPGGLRDEDGSDLGLQEVGHLKRVLFTLTPSAPPVPPKAPARSAEEPAPHATLIIPTRDHVELLRGLCDSLGRTSGSYDLVVVDNGSEDPAALAYLDRLAARPDAQVLRRPGPFNFSALVNAGAEAARGPILVLLNNDCEIIEDDWLQRLAALAVQPAIGAVGATLLYANDTLQHAGVGLGLGGEAGHRDRKMPRDHRGNLNRMTVPHEVAAVTAACLAVRRDAFLQAGGFDEAFPVAFNDIDFCLRLLRAGYRNILEPGAVLRHAESASRGLDEGPRRARFLREAALFRERWQELLLDDPYGHPMFSTFRFYDRVG